MGPIANFIAIILILVAPLGVAGQNAGLGLSILLFGLFCLKDRGASLKNTLKSPTVHQYFLIWFVTLVPILMATLANNQLKEAGRFFLGYTLVLPMFVMGLSLNQHISSRKTLKIFSTSLLCFMALISLTQYINGWKLDGFTLMPQINRAQGFYSHPLTLAYGALAIMPLMLARALAHPKDWQASLSAVAILTIIMTSQSVTVITLTLMTLVILSIRLLTRKQLLTLSLLASVSGLSIFLTPNPISHKFQIVLQGQRSDHETPYTDDRIAFWKAHWEMLKDAPIAGHGSEITRDIRKPYYERIGLGHIKRMYEAHNMFLQTAVEGGVISALGLLSFFIWWTLKARMFQSNESWIFWASRLTPIVFAAGGLTQNAVQDSEVRYLLILSLTVCFGFLHKLKPITN
jgi:O-antigen ligase